jgi:retron-type reverse transcriptase
VQRWLGELALALRQESYRPNPIRRVFIPKPNGKLRPLGISSLRDRVCMTAAMLVLEPIFEAHLPPEQYAIDRAAAQAVIAVQETLSRGHPEVVDADLEDYFGSIPHAELMLSLARRISDARVLHPKQTSSLIVPKAATASTRRAMSRAAPSAVQYEHGSRGSAP